LLELLRTGLPPLAAVGATVAFDLATRRRGLDPPGFREPARRVAGLGTVALVLWIAVFLPLARIGSEVEPDLSKVPTWQLFLLHVLLLGALASWWVAGFAGRGAGAASFSEQIGLAVAGARARWREIGLGVVFGVAAWCAVIATLVVVALVLAALGGEGLLPKQPPALIPWLAGRPLLVRVGLALSAGAVEEMFFRGLLQPRIGLAASTAMFALAHLSYGQPFVLVGVTLLSVLYGLLVRWRQNLWAAMTAHALFDGIQLLIVIPTILRQFYGGPPLS
jgi:membrane protease YdiL (CAAX protease family)